VVVRHGVDLDVYRPGDGPRAPGPLRVLAVGRLVEKKGFHHLVDALGRLAGTGIAFEARIVGDGPDGPALAAQAMALGLGDRLAFVPACPPADVRERMRGWADVLVAPSVVARDGDRDGIPNVVGEALACGVPVVATTAGGLPELVEDGVNGIVVPEGAPAALAAALARLATAPALREALAARARETAAARFDARENVARFLEVLEAGGARGG
ncbi:MAG: glycosyltransferase, partial [Planctomycetia bacterium]|nr:glycosyltransferase [Planctomycetia bacterium]